MQHGSNLTHQSIAVVVNAAVDTKEITRLKPFRRMLRQLQMSPVRVPRSQCLIRNLLSVIARTSV